MDRRAEGNFSGRLYHGYREDGLHFASIDEALDALDELYNSLRFPFPSTKERTFAPNNHHPQQLERGDRIMKDETLLSKHGELGTFIIRVQQRQNSSWQGRITWSERNQTLHFRSTWEMVKLIESAIDIVCHTDSSDGATWREDPEDALPEESGKKKA